MSKITRVVMVRHGQTEWNRDERFRGRVDVPLDETGVRQAERAAAHVKAEHTVSAIYSSPLSRARQTADALARVFGVEVRELAGLNDLHFGAWEGLTLGEASERYPELYRVWREAPHCLALPGGETLDEVRQRALETLRTVSTRHIGQTIALVTHRVVCKVLLCAVLGLDNSRFWSIEQGTTAINVFDVVDVDRELYTVRLVNDTCHLRGLS